MPNEYKKPDIEIDGDGNVIGDGSSSRMVRSSGDIGEVHIGDRVYSQSDVQKLDDYLSQAISSFERRMYRSVARAAGPREHPYKFLYPFDIEDEDIFFGRDAASQAFYEVVVNERLTVLHAKSGAGKTSLINAGLSSRLVHEDRLPVYARAYDDPVQAVKRVIASPSSGPWPEILHELTLHEFLSLACDRLSRQTQEIVVVLDQFEEFFIFRPKREHRQPFIDALGDCYDDKSLSVRFIVALRKDYYSDLATFQRRLPHIFHNEYYLEAMTREEARAAITGPVSKLAHSVTYERGLLDALLSDLDRGGIELPYLQIICTRLYETLEEGETAITLASYEDLGRAQGVLGGYLNSVLDRLPDGQRTIAKDVLKELVSSEATKRVLSYDKLAARIGAEEDELSDVLARLVDARLLRRDDVAGESVYEMVHEYLIKVIEEWIDQADLMLKYVEELLAREVANWRVHGTLIPRDRLELLHAQRERLKGLSDDARECLLHSALQANHAVEDWAKLAGESGEQLLLAALDDPSEEMRRAATRGLSAVWGLPQMLKLADDRSAARQGAIQILGDLGDPCAVEPLVAALRDENRFVRRAAVQVLGDLGDPRAVEPLIAALRDESSDVIRAAAYALTRIGERAVEPLIGALQSEEEAACVVAARVLGHLGDPRAVEPLGAVLQDQDKHVRRASAEALKRIGAPKAMEKMQGPASCSDNGSLEQLLERDDRSTDVLQSLSKIPHRVHRIGELAGNLWWSWHREARDLFKMLDYTLWRATSHNPVEMLLEVSPERLAEVASDPLFLRQYDAVMMALDADVKNGHLWFPTHYRGLTDRPVAYFAAEFGVHQSIPIYSSTSRLLAGDYAKEASDLGLPFVGVGFLSRQGSFRQNMTSDGWQDSVDVPVRFSEAPIRPILDESGEQLHIQVQLDVHTVYIQLWGVQVGRISLYLMDTDIEENDPWDRELTQRLYLDDQQMRVKQGILLGLGGLRTLRASGINPQIFHLNGELSAFTALELVRELVEAGWSFDQACQAVQARTVFSTHTLVPVRQDVFPFQMVERYSHAYWPRLGLSRDQFLELGSHEGGFNMTVLALRMCGECDTVSQLHGEVSRQMGPSGWCDRPVEQVPIDHVTNGVHVPAWIGGSMYRLYRRHLGPDWIEHHDDPSLWERILESPNRELWDAHVHLKGKLMTLIRERARQRGRASEARNPNQVSPSGPFLDPDALIIGFARRFATCNRATLLFHDLERLKRLLQDQYRPVQFIFAGKAHPADYEGKRLLQEIYNTAKDPAMERRIAFIEDYDMQVARYLVQGVDVWLNTSRLPLEAGGTSGMRAAINGVPNLSVLGGWWMEAYNGLNGWVINPDQRYDDQATQDAADAEALYGCLESEIVPLFYMRDADGVPRDWVRVMKETIRTVTPQFCARRTVKEYTERFYVPAVSASNVTDDAV